MILKSAGCRGNCDAGDGQCEGMGAGAGADAEGGALFVPQIPTGPVSHN